MRRPSPDGRLFRCDRSRLPNSRWEPRRTARVEQERMRHSSFVPILLRALAALVLAVVIAAPTRAQSPSHSEPPSLKSPNPALLYLTWHAPWGQPGATQQMSFQGSDTTRVDTLFLAFDPGAKAPGFIGLSSVLYFWPAAGDTLGSFWHFERDGENPMSCQVSFDVTGYESMSPWKSTGMGLPRYKHDRMGGMLPFIYAVPAGTGTQLESGKIYVIGRVLISHKRAQLPGHRQATRMEWGDAEFGRTSELMAQGRGGSTSVVSWNSPSGKACEGMGKTRGAVTLPDSTRGWKGMAR